MCITKSRKSITDLSTVAFPVLSWLSPAMFLPLYALYLLCARAAGRAAGNLASYKVLSLWCFNAGLALRQLMCRSCRVVLHCAFFLFFSLFDLISKSFILLDRLLDRLNNFRSIALQLAIFHCIGISMFLDLHCNAYSFLIPFGCFYLWYCPAMLV